MSSELSAVQIVHFQAAADFLDMVAVDFLDMHLAADYCNFGLAADFVAGCIAVDCHLGTDFVADLDPFAVAADRRRPFADFSP